MVYRIYGFIAFMVLSHLYDGILIYHFICDRVNPNSEMNGELRN